MTQLLTVVQEVLYWAAALMFAGFASAAWVKPLRPHRTRLLWLAVCLMTLAAVARWVVTGHPPIFGTFENSMAATWAVGVFLILEGQGRLRGILPSRVAPFFALWIPVFLGFGMFFNRTPLPLTISERSIFVDVHVTFAWLAHTMLLATSTLAICIVSGRFGESPSVEWDEALLRGAGAGFALFTLMISVGSFYSYLLFADWFRWEITEAFAADSWLAYGLAIHSFLFFGWRGKKLAWLVLIALPLMLGTFWVWSLYPGTYHHFEIPLLRAS